MFGLAVGIVGSAVFVAIQRANHPWPEQIAREQQVRRQAENLRAETDHARWKNG